MAFVKDEYNRMEDFELFSKTDVKLIKKLEGITDANKRARIIKKDTKSKLDIELIKQLDGITDPTEKAKIITNYITIDSLVTYENQVKKDRNIKGRKTRHSDLEAMLNAHLKNTDNPHVHFMKHSFCPITKKWLNPIAFKHTKQLVHLAMEAKYSDFLLQGIAIGEYKHKGKLALTEFLSESLYKGQNWKEARQSFKDIKYKINKEITSNKSTENVISDLEKEGIFISLDGLTLSGKNRMKIRIKGFKAELNSESFTTKNTRSFETNIKKFMERLDFDNMTKSTHKIDKVQTLLESVLEETKNKLERDLRNAEPEEHKSIKQAAFKDFTNRSLKAGLIVNLNKQGNLLFHKIDENHYENEDGVVENNAKSRKVKASMLQNPELQGKALMNMFELDEELIIKHQQEVFQLMPKTAMYRDVVYFNTKLSEMNLVEKELRIKEQYKYTLKRFNLEAKIDENGNVFMFDEKGNALVNKTYKSDGISSSYSLNNLHPKIAAPILLSMLQEDARALKDNQTLEITPEVGETDLDYLRYLEIDLMFSTDVNSKKIRVDYPDKSIDTKLQTMIEQRLDKELERFANNVDKYSKGKTKYTFTEASGIHLLTDPNFIDYHDKISEQFNTQIIDMIAERGVTEIKFSNKDKSYFNKNEKELLELASSLSEEKRKLVIKVIESHKEKDNKAVKNENKVKQKAKPSRPSY